MRAKYTLPIILILTLLAAILFRISSNETGTIEYVELKRNTTCLGTFGTFIIIADSTNTNAIMNSVDSLVRHLEFETGIFSDGELNRLNSTGIIILSDCSEDMRFLLEQSLYIASITDSLFDPSLGALTELWGFPQNPHLPDSSEIDSVLRTSGVSALEISNDIIRMPREMKLDLGAIAKGYVVDRAYDLALSLGAEGVLIEIGGEIRCGSTDNIARIWTISFRNTCPTGIFGTF